MKGTLSDEEIHHPLNESLLKEASQIKNEKALLRQRIEKLDQCRAGVSPAVYQRVHADYLAQLNKVTEKMASLKKGLEDEQKALVDKKTLIEVAIKHHNENIEESQLRHSLGEHPAQHHQEVIGKETTEIKRLEAALQTLNGGIERHRAIFEEEDLVKESAEPKAAPPSHTPLAKPKIPPRIPSSPVIPPPSGDVTRVMEAVHDERTDRFAQAHASSPPSPLGKGPELLVMENGKVVQMVPLGRSIVIGRSPSNDVILKEPKVSRKHAEIQHAGGKYILLDLESSNGTYVRGKRVTELVLQPNDEIMIGNTKMVFKV